MSESMSDRISGRVPCNPGVFEGQPNAFGVAKDCKKWCHAETVCVCVCVCERFCVYACVYEGEGVRA